MITIDGSFGEGGGQILRTSLALSLVTQTPVRIERIRARRPKPGLQRQHLTAVEAAAAVSGAQVEGAALGAQRVTFSPGPVRAGDYRFSVGTAGSTTLILQAVLPALLTAEGESTLTLEGGTHNPMAPPFDFMQRVFLPLLERMGAQVEVSLERAGFYPLGGGKLVARVKPIAQLVPLELRERGALRRTSARALVARLPRHIAERELSVIADKLDLPDDCLTVEEETTSVGPGNVVTLEVESAHVTELFTSFGARGKPAEQVARQVVREARHYLKAEVPVGQHLADQLLLPLAVAGGGSFVTLPLSPHATTNIEVIKRFLPVEVSFAALSQHAWLVDVKRG